MTMFVCIFCFQAKGKIESFFLIGKEGYKVKTPKLLSGVREMVGIEVFE